MKSILSTLLFTLFLPSMMSAGLTDHVTETVLPNGLKVIIRENHNAPLVYVGMWYKAGFRNERPGNIGIAHLLEHMLFRSTKNFPNSRIKESLTEIGAMANGWTGYDTTCYFEEIPSSRLGLALDIERDRMEYGLAEPKELDTERNVVLSEINNGRNNPDILLSEKLLNEAFPGHPMVQFAMTNHVQNLKDETFDQLKAFYLKYYLPNNAYLIIHGDVNPQKVIEEVKSRFAEIPAGQPVSPDPVPAGRRSTNSVTVEGVAPNSYGRILYYAPSLDLNNRDYIVLRFLALSGLAGGISYSPGIDASCISSGFNGKEATFYDETIDDKMLEKELPRAKERMKAAESNSYQNLMSAANMLGDLERYGSWTNYSVLWNLMDSVTASEALSAVHRYLNRTNAVTGYFIAKKKDANKKANTDFTIHDEFNKGATLSVSQEGSEQELSNYRRELEEFSAGHKEAVNRFLDGILDVKLSNGLRVIVKENTQSDLVSIRMSVPAGIAYNDTGKPKIADIVCSLVSDGGPNVRLRNSLKQKSAGMGGGTDFDFAYFVGGGNSANLNELLQLMGGAIIDRKFPDIVLREKCNDFERELSRADQNNYPYYFANRMMSQLLYPKAHPLYTDNHAEIPDYAGITLADVQDFYARHYQANGSVIVIVGNVKKEEALNYVDKVFGSWKRGSEKVESPSVPSLVLPETNVIQTKSMPGKSQNVVVFGDKGVSIDSPDYYGVSLMSMIIGNGGFLNSRVSKAIREDLGISYSAGFWFGFSREECSMSGYIQTDPKDMEKAMAAFLRVLKEAGEKPVFEKELLLAKINIFARSAFNLETVYQQSYSLLTAACYYGTPEAIKESGDRYAAVTRDDVLDCARKYLHPDRIYISVAGNLDK